MWGQVADAALEIYFSACPLGTQIMRCGGNT